jgi:hypothetical protein
MGGVFEVRPLLLLCGLTVVRPFLVTVVRADSGAASPCDCCVS